MPLSPRPTLRIQMHSLSLWPPAIRVGPCCKLVSETTPCRKRTVRARTHCVSAFRPLVCREARGGSGCHEGWIRLLGGISGCWVEFVFQKINGLRCLSQARGNVLSAHESGTAVPPLASAASACPLASPPTPAVGAVTTSCSCCTGVWGPAVPGRWQGTERGVEEGAQCREGWGQVHAFLALLQGKYCRSTVAHPKRRSMRLFLHRGESCCRCLIGHPFALS